MTSRERVLRAFGSRPGNPDRPPLQFDLCQNLLEEFGGRLGIPPDYSLSYYEDLTYRISANDIRVAMGSDCVVVGATVPEGYTPERVCDDVTLNEFGMEMKPTPLYVEIVKCPLAGVSSVDQVDEYDLPDPDASGRYTKAKRDISRFGQSHYVIGDVELTLFEMAWHLTGLSHYLLALALEERWVETLNEKVEAFSTFLALRLAEYGADAIWFGEDLRTQTSTLISPEMWRERFKPRHRRIISTLKEHFPDIKVIMHSDGAVAPVIDDFIEIGVDVYNPVQPKVPGSDPAELQEKYGGRICFFGGLDQQDLMPSGDVGAIREQIHHLAEILGSDGNYLIAPAHIIQADVAPETVEAMVTAVLEMA